MVNLRPLADRNFVASSVIIFANYAVLYGALTSLPGMLQTLFGYDATHAGLVMSPAGLFALDDAAGRRLPAGPRGRRPLAGRWPGLLLVAAGNYWMSQLNLDISPGQVVWPRVVQTVGTSLLFAPLNVAAYMYLPKELRGSAAGLYNLLRNEGGASGPRWPRRSSSAASSSTPRGSARALDPLNPNVTEALAAPRGLGLSATGDPARRRPDGDCRCSRTSATSRRRRCRTSTASGSSPCSPPR